MSVPRLQARMQGSSGDRAELPRSLPQLTYIALARYTGANEAITLAEEMKACGYPASTF
ncbi:MAG: hypothetical protein ACRDJX_00855 [Solirubrobacteraceae bacterium]